MTTSAFRTRRAVLRPLTVLAAGFATALAGAVVAAAPAHAAVASITAPAAARTGASVVLDGASWPAYANVNVYLVHNTVSTFMCTLHSDSTGAIPDSTCTVPISIVADSYVPHADDAHGHTADAAAM